MENKEPDKKVKRKKATPKDEGASWAGGIAVFLLIVAVATAIFLFILGGLKFDDGFYYFGEIGYWLQKKPYLRTTTVGKLRAKSLEIYDLRRNLESKRREVVALHGGFQKGNDKLYKEIYDIKRKKRIRTYEEAVKEPRIRKNLLLIQRRLAYMERLDEVFIRMDEGVEELLYLERKTDDDIELVSVLGKEEIKGLLKNINQALEKYMPDAGELIIDVKDVEMHAPEEIWKDIVKNKR